ncbi:hypothetical protein AAMO2058_000148600 [Amorphochlora amoebiformis]
MEPRWQRSAVSSTTRKRHQWVAAILGVSILAAALPGFPRQHRGLLQTGDDGKHSGRGLGSIHSCSDPVPARISQGSYDYNSHRGRLNLRGGRLWRVSSGVIAGGLAWLGRSLGQAAHANGTNPSTYGIISMGRIDIEKLEQAVRVFYSAPSEEIRKAAENELQALQEDVTAWQYVPPVLESTASPTAKYFALQILEKLVKTRWKILHPSQREGIKNFLSSYIIRLSEQEGLPSSFVNKLNIVLLQVVKHEWPSNWPTFIPDLVNACKASQGLCTNILTILKMLSEDIFDYSAGEMTKAKENLLKETLTAEAQPIFELCSNIIMSAVENPQVMYQDEKHAQVVRKAIDTIAVYLRWLSLNIVFRSPLVQILIKVFPQPRFRNSALRCLTEIVAQPPPTAVGFEVDKTYVDLYTTFMSTLMQMVPPGTDLAGAYKSAQQEDREFVSHLTFFFTTMFKNHQRLLENLDQEGYLRGLDYLIVITSVPDTEIFRAALGFWRSFVASFFRRQNPNSNSRTPARSSTEAREKYAGVLHKVREIMATRMAKPEEVIVVEDENGNIVRETVKNDQERMRYRIMRECMVYLTHLDHDDTEQLLRDKLRLQVTGSFEWNSLNTICWAIGSISGSMHEDQEDRFLVSNIRDLLNLCETVRGKDNKAVIASNIMYIVGQYPRFLRAHWRFLKTVVQKVFEFMHEPHPGVQDMACETLIKVTRRCHRHFGVVQAGESRPYVEVVIEQVPDLIRDLEPHQVEKFYEAVGVMVNSVQNQEKKQRYLTALMNLPNQLWTQVMNRFRNDPSALVDANEIRKINQILKTNIAVCASVGASFLPQLQRIHQALVQVYKAHSGTLSRYIDKTGPAACHTSQAKQLRTVRKTALKLYTTFINTKGAPTVLIAEQFVPSLMETILADYRDSIPDAREPEALSLFATIIEKLGPDPTSHQHILNIIPSVFEHVFEVTLQVITKNFEDYPQHRLAFFVLLKNINEYCFEAMLALNEAQTQMVVDSVVWAFRHTERNIAERGMELFLSMITKFASSVKCNDFFSRYMLKLVQELFAVLTDTFHKTNFKLHAMTLQRLMMIADSPTLTVQLWNPAMGQQYTSNSEFLHHHMITLLQTAFPNVHPSEVKVFVDGLYSAKREPPKFKQFMRDFIVQTKEFSNLDNKDLYADEQAAVEAANEQQLAEIPGMKAPE